MGGSDGLAPLGRKEAGGIAALPMWTEFIGKILNGVPEDVFTTPAGLQTVRIDKRTGERASGDGSMMEFFFDGALPEGVAHNTTSVQSLDSASTQGSTSTPTLNISKSQKKVEVDGLF